MSVKMLRVVQIVLLMVAVSAFGPPSVEIPPVDENQMRSGHQRRDSGQRSNHQGSYSYGTTAYHQQQQPSGYATAHLTTQSRTVVLDRRTECQDPMLRTFFSYCHPPGSAPQSPVQCEPIPGQTSFRCLIKQQRWPVVRITQCPPGMASSSGECVRVPGSFSTGGVMITPVADGQAPTPVRTNTVYRHCSNGACQTCIGDQCSTTGVQTPVSVDHRGRANSTTEIVAFGDAGRDVKQKCSGRFCKTCVDRICYDRTYPLLRVTAGCPPAVCDNDCQEFVYWTDNCPICRCRGFATREPCRSQNECPAGGACRNQVCVYGELPNTHFDKVCTFSSQCPTDQMCYNWRCGAKPAQSRHLEQSCASNGDCPSGYTCADMTCWQGDHTRLRGQHCTLDHQCPTAYFCTNGTCTDVYHHGSFGSFDSDEVTIPPTTDRQCENDQQCHGHERCWERRCVTVEEYRWMDEARRRQQSEHESWRPQTTTISPRESPEQEYQRRMAEYNRQVAEHQRQYEQRRRQMEEEKRRHEEAEVQRRRQEQEEAERRRQQQENERRRREQEDERRRLELQEQRRRQQDEENQRRIREHEEAQRRETESQNRLREQQEREQAARRRQEQDAEDARRRQQQETESRRMQGQVSVRQGQEDEEARRQEQEAEARRRQVQEAEMRRRQEEETESRRRHEQEEARRRQEQEEASRRHGQGTEESGRHGQAPQPEGIYEEDPEPHSDPAPDIEVGEETVDVGPYDDDEEYERRMQEYNRQLRERQRQLQEDDEEPSEHSHVYPTTQNPVQQPETTVSNDENDFYGRSRQRARLPIRDQSVSLYRVRYQRYQRRQ